MHQAQKRSEASTQTQRQTSTHTHKRKDTQTRKHTSTRTNASTHRRTNTDIQTHKHTDKHRHNKSQPEARERKAAWRVGRTSRRAHVGGLQGRTCPAAAGRAKCRAYWGARGAGHAGRMRPTQRTKFSTVPAIAIVPSVPINIGKTFQYTAVEICGDTSAVRVRY